MQDVGKARLENHADMLIIQAIKDGTTRPPRFHQPRRAQDPQLVAHRGLAELQLFGNLVHRDLPRHEDLDNADSGGIPKKLEEFGQLEEGVQGKRLINI